MLHGKACTCTRKGWCMCIGCCSFFLSCAVRSRVVRALAVASSFSEETYPSLSSSDVSSIFLLFLFDLLQAQARFNLHYCNTRTQHYMYLFSHSPFSSKGSQARSAICNFSEALVFGVIWFVQRPLRLVCLMKLICPLRVAQRRNITSLGHRFLFSCLLHLSSIRLPIDSGFLA